MNINFYVVVPAVVLSHLIAFGIGLVNNLMYTHQEHIVECIPNEIPSIKYIIISRIVQVLNI